MEIKATFICTAAKVAACRAAQTGAAFSCALWPIGNATGPATHYASSGHLPEADADALVGLCDITTGQHTFLDVIAAAGLTTDSQN